MLDSEEGNVNLSIECELLEDLVSQLISGDTATINGIIKYDL